MLNKKKLLFLQEQTQSISIFIPEFVDEYSPAGAPIMYRVPQGSSFGPLLINTRLPFIATQNTNLSGQNKRFIEVFIKLLRLQPGYMMDKCMDKFKLSEFQ